MFIRITHRTKPIQHFQNSKIQQIQKIQIQLIQLQRIPQILANKMKPYQFSQKITQQLHPNLNKMQLKKLSQRYFKPQFYKHYQLQLIGELRVQSQLLNNKVHVVHVGLTLQLEHLKVYIKSREDL